MNACRVSAEKAKARDMNSHCGGTGKFRGKMLKCKDQKYAVDRDELWSFHAICNRKIEVVGAVDYADKHTEIFLTALG